MASPSSVRGCVVCLRYTLSGGVGKGKTATHLAPRQWRAAKWMLSTVPMPDYGYAAGVYTSDSVWLAESRCKLNVPLKLFWNPLVLNMADALSEASSVGPL
jgi:hypothetical protein